MKEALFLLVLWYIIVAIHYFLAKYITAGLDERQFNEVVSPPYLLPWRRMRKSKAKESGMMIVGFVVFGLVTMAWSYIFIGLRRLLFQRPDWLYFSEEYAIVIAVILGIVAAILFLLATTRHTYTPDKLWVRQPSHQEALNISGKLKRRGLIWAIVLQFFFVMAIADGTIIKNDLIYVRNFSFLPNIYTYDEVSRLELYVTNNNDEVLPHFKLYFEDNNRVDLMPNTGLMSEKELKELKIVARYLDLHGVPIGVDLGIMERQALRAKFVEKYRLRIEELFAFAENLKDGIADDYNIGETVQYETASYTIDSVTVPPTREWLSKNSGDYYLDVHWTIENHHETDTLYFSSLLKVAITDDSSKVYKVSFLSTPEHELESRIPPLSESKGPIRFKIDEGAENLKLSYQLSIFKKQYLYFNLE